MHRNQMNIQVAGPNECRLSNRTCLSFLLAEYFSVSLQRTLLPSSGVGCAIIIGICMAMPWVIPAFKANRFLIWIPMLIAGSIFSPCLYMILDK